MAEPGRLGQLRGTHGGLDHRIDHHVAGLARLGQLRVHVHEVGQERLVERAPVDPDADRLVVVDRDPDDGLEVLVVSLGAHVAGVDPVLRQALRHLRVLDQELMAVVMEVADDRDADAEIVELPADLGDRGRRGVVVDRHADELAAGVGEPRDLERRGVGVGRVGVGHRLHDDRVAAPDRDPAHVDRHGPAAGGAHGAAPRRAMSKPEIHRMKAIRNTKPTA